MIGGLAAGAATFFPGLAAAGHRPCGANQRADSLLGFTPVPIAEGSGPWPGIASEYQFDILIPWGDPIEPGGPGFRYPPNAADQALQLGIGHDGMAYFPIHPEDGGSGDGRERVETRARFGRGNRRGLLAINHEFGTNKHVLGKNAPDSLEDVRVSQRAHGVSVVEIEKRDGRWRPVASDYARRIHANTPMAISGPAAGSKALLTPNGNVALGTLANCASGTTPWGTYLTCEENFHAYFGASRLAADWQATAEQARYGFGASGSGYGWHLFDRRFDLSDPGYVNEENRFGWVVEIDPFDATRSPVKRTALGRFKHESAAVAIGRGGRAVVYMGDDDRFDYIYKFVSSGHYRRMLDDGISPLDDGRLYVARFSDNGTGDWLELTIDHPLLAARFSDQAEVLTYARISADLLGATPMDRPEWTTVAPDGHVYCALTHNSRRTTPNAANPLAPNPDGHIIRWMDSEQFVGLGFTWEVFLIAKDTHGGENAFGSPDGLWADPDGRLFIQTDGSQPGGLNDQMLVADIATGDLRRLFTGVTGCEVTGIATTPDRRTMFVNIQHPGNGDPALTNFPAVTDGITVPRDATMVITRKDGGIVGS